MPDLSRGFIRLRSLNSEWNQPANGQRILSAMYPVRKPGLSIIQPQYVLAAEDMYRKIQVMGHT